MFKLEPVQDLLVNRSLIFSSLYNLVGFHLHKETLIKDSEYALDIAARKPTFKIEKPMSLEYEDLSDTVYDTALWTLPFEKFSVAEVSTDDFTGIPNGYVSIFVISRVPSLPERDTDTIMVQSFMRTPGQHYLWTQGVPFRFSLGLASGKKYTIEHYLPLSDGKTEKDFRAALNSRAVASDANAFDAFDSIRKEYASSIVRFLTMLNSKTNILFLPERECASIQAAAKAKKAFWQYNRVELGTRNSPVPYKGGHHASPRQHERRGHFRTYASGKKTWVPSCLVGNIENGVIVKDYEMKRKHDA